MATGLGEGSARGVMVTVLGNGHGNTLVQILDETVYSSHSAKTLGKGVKPIIILLARGKK